MGFFFENNQALRVTLQIVARFLRFCCDASPCLLQSVPGCEHCIW